VQPVGLRHGRPPHASTQPLAGRAARRFSILPNASVSPDDLRSFADRFTDLADVVIMDDAWR
jgi:hypothetical protein